MNPDFVHAAFFSAAGLIVLITSGIARVIEVIHDRHQLDTQWPDHNKPATHTTLDELLYTIHPSHHQDKAA